MKLNYVKEIFVALVLAMSLSGCFEGPAGSLGIQGLAGHDGAQGPQGIPGIGCSGQNVLPGDPVLPYGGAVITCANGSFLIANGAPGQDGTPAPVTPYSIVEIMDPCGNSAAFHEVFLRFANGSVIASFSDDTNGKWTRLSELVDGYNLMTTDHTGCTFDLSTSGITRTITWHSGGSESWSPQ